MNRIFLLLYFLFICNDLVSQSWLKGTTISFAYAQSPQDRRNASTLVLSDKIEPDIQYAGAVEHTIYSKKRLESSIGLGYSVFTTKFSRIYNDFYFSSDAEGHTAFGAFLDIYKINLIHTPIRCNYMLTNNKDVNIYLNMMLFPGIAHRRWLKSKAFIPNRSKNEIRFENIEMNPGVGLRVYRFEILLNYRALNFAHRDPVTYSPNSYSDAEKNYDWYNPFKLWLSIGYRLK